MSTDAPQWYVTQYNKTAQHKLQSKGFLTRGMAAAPVSVTGNIARFFILGKGKAVERPLIAQPVKPMNLGKSYIDLTMKNFQAAEYIPHGEPEQMSVNEQALIAEAGAMAMGRKFDDLLFRELDGNADIETIGDGTAYMDPGVGGVAKAAITGLGSAAMNEFFCPLPSFAFEQMKLYKVFANSQYIGPDLPLIRNTEAKTWNGVNWFVMPGGFDKDGNLLEDSVFSSPAATKIDTYLWHKSQLGFGSNYEVSAKITYENIMTSWLYNNTGNAGWKVLQPEGIKRLRIKLDRTLDLSHA
jgi:hypothetical protein